MDRIDQKQLFSEFSALGSEAWKNKVAHDLKDADALHRLNWEMVEGISMPPYFTQEDNAKVAYLGQLDNRKAHPAPETYGSRHWYNQPRCTGDNDHAINKTILRHLENGADGIWLDLSGRNADDIDFAQIFKGVQLQHIGLYFTLPPSGNANVALMEYMAGTGMDKSVLQGNLSMDILANMWRSGKVAEESDWDALTEMIKVSGRNQRTLCIDTSDIHNSGGSMVQELAFGLLSLSTYVSYLDKKGIPLPHIFANLHLSIAVGSDYFGEIAKLRAYQALFAGVAKVYGIDAYPFMHVQTSRWSKTALDADTNMLRNTTEAMAAILGGCDALTVHPHDGMRPGTGSLGERIARNVSNILKEESYFDKSIDPAAGSYYINHLTDALIGKAWEMFQTLAKQGDLIQVFEEGTFEKELEMTRKLRRDSVATGRRTVIGANRYISPGGDFLGENTPQSQNSMGNASEELERARVQNMSRAKGTSVMTPVLLDDTPLAKTRAQVVTDLCAAVGHTVDAPTKLKGSDMATTPLLLLCGSDHTYEAGLIDLFDELKKRHPSQAIFIAGMPKEAREALEERGVAGFIHLRSDLREVAAQINGFLDKR